MIEYANDSVIKELKQYDMLSRSLKLTEDLDQRQALCYQMTKIIKRVLELTNKIYENKYLRLENKTTYLMDEEKERLTELVNLINERRTYINNQMSSNEELTGLTPDYIYVLGEDKIDNYKEEIEIIDKYKENIKLNSTLKDEIVNLDKSIKKAKEKISTNKIMNRQLEDKMVRVIDRAINKLSLKELKERENEIDLAYTELGYSLEKAKENARIARKDCSTEIIQECDNMLSSITLEYERYKEKKYILKLMELYKEETHNYEELLNKRERINKILTGIVGSEIYLEIGEELNKEYAAIKLEQQDAATLRSLEEEKEKKQRILEDIKIENASDKFKGILVHLLENEKKYQAKLLEEKKRKEEQRKARELEEEKRRRKEMMHRQKLLEEERKKEIEERTKQLLVEKKNPILFTSKTDNKEIDFTKKEKEIDNIFAHETSVRKDKSIHKDMFENNNKNKSNNIFKGTSINREKPNITRASVKPSDDIFSRKTISKKDDDSIPFVKNTNLRNNFVSTKKTNINKTEIFPKTKLKKEENIFPSFPDIDKSDSFFDKDEFEDLNKFVEDDKKKSWF